MSRLGIALVCFVMASDVYGGDGPTMDQAERLMRSRKWKKAAAAYEIITAAQPDNGPAWFELARACHFLKDYDRAIEANQKAAQFPDLEATSLYNLACAWGLKGDAGRANDALERAMRAGFLDLDLIATDPDLEIVRRNNSFAFPTERKYEIYEGHRTKFRYCVVLPEPFDKNKTYPAAFAFPPGQGSRSADWTLEHLWGGRAAGEDWIVVVPVAPEDGWWTHPFHHGMEALLKRLRKKYKVAGDKFHLVGFAAGAAPALTYSRMSAKYFQSLSTAAAYSWARWDDGDLKAFAKRDIPVYLFVGKDDDHGLKIARGVHEALTHAGGRSTLRVLPNQDRQMLDLHHGQWLAEISALIEQGD